MEGTIGEIRMFAGNFEPLGWSFCQGKMMAIDQYSALFSILGTNYGGDGQMTFALPNLAGRVAVNSGQGPGLSNYQLGEAIGTESTTLTVQNLPTHSHVMMATSDSPSQNTAGGGSLASNTRSTSPTMPNIYENGANNQVAMASQTESNGSNSPFNIIQPVLGMNYIICLEGNYPSRN